MEKPQMECFSYLEPRTKIHERIFHSFFFFGFPDWRHIKYIRHIKCADTVYEDLHCRQSIKHLTDNVAPYAHTDTYRYCRQMYSL